MTQARRKPLPKSAVHAAAAAASREGPAVDASDCEACSSSDDDSDAPRPVPRRVQLTTRVWLARFGFAAPVSGRAGARNVLTNGAAAERKSRTLGLVLLRTSRGRRERSPTPQKRVGTVLVRPRSGSSPRRRAAGGFIPVPRRRLDAGENHFGASRVGRRAVDGRVGARARARVSSSALVAARRVPAAERESRPSAL